MSKLLDYLNEQGLTQAELARRMKMEPETVNRVVHGKQNPGGDFIVAFWQATKTDPETLTSIFNLEN